MTDIVKGISFKCIFFPLDMIFTPIRADTPHQIWYPPSNLVHPFPIRPCIPMDLATFPLLDLVFPLDLVPPIGIRMTVPSHEVVILTYGHGEKHILF